MANILAQPFPNIHYSCPCSESPIAVSSSSPTKKGHRASIIVTPGEDSSEDEEEEKTFDPHAPRAPFSLYPLDHLLYCEDCNQVRCPRCVQDEIVCYYCPSCLFEVPSSTVKSEGNRCSRNCFSCPICSASLTVAATGEDQTGPFVLLCSHCLWSSSEIGIDFEKPTSITAQLAQKLKPLSLNSGTATPESFIMSPLSPTSGSGSYFPSSVGGGPNNAQSDAVMQTDEEAFARLKSHYNQQKAASSHEDYGSSGSLSRLMGLYSVSGGGRIRSYGASALSKAGSTKNKDLWTDWDAAREVDDEDETIKEIRDAGYERTTTQEQRVSQPHNPRTLDDIRPLAALLRTKRSKRCRACRHILTKPESKVNTTRFRIKLVAMNYIPQLSLSRLDPTAVSYTNLQPGKTHQFLLTVTNPLFDPVSITLATPEKTPGQYSSTVTILCPEFEVGANTDVWDEALQSATAQPNSKSKGKRSGLPGTIWDSGRNWTSVIIEVIPPRLPDDDELLDEREKIVQVPVLVRSVYETDIERDEAGLGSGKEGKEKKEQSYWTVLEIGRIGKPGAKEDVGLGNTPMRPVSMMPFNTAGPGADAAGRINPSRHSMR